MADAPDRSDTDALEATVARCLECGTEMDDPTVEECDNCGPDGVLEHYHVSDKPLGYDNDDDYKIAGHGRPDRWEYDAEDPRPPRRYSLSRDDAILDAPASYTTEPGPQGG